MVTEYTPTHHNGTRSIIDLLFDNVSNPQLVRCCTIIPPLHNSDHSGLKINLSLRSTLAATKRCMVWRYKHADWDKACGLINSTDWKSLIDQSDVNKSWSTMIGVKDLYKLCMDVFHQAPFLLVETAHG